MHHQEQNSVLYPNPIFFDNINFDCSQYPFTQKISPDIGKFCFKFIVG